MKTKEITADITIGKNNEIFVKDLDSDLKLMITKDNILSIGSKPYTKSKFGDWSLILTFTFEEKRYEAVINEHNFRLLNHMLKPRKEPLILESKSESGILVQNVVRNQILVPKEISVLKCQLSLNYEILKTMNEVEIKEVLYKHFRG